MKPQKHKYFTIILQFAMEAGQGFKMKKAEENTFFGPFGCFSEVILLPHN